MNDDPIVSETRRIRDKLAAQFDYDVGAIFQDLKSKQKKVTSRLVNRTKKDAAEQATGFDSGSRARKLA